MFVANLLRVRTLSDGHLSGGVWKWLKTPRLHLKIMTGSYLMKTVVKEGERKGNKFTVHKNFNPLNAELNPICKSQLAELFCRVFKFCT